MAEFAHTERHPDRDHAGAREKGVLQAVRIFLSATPTTRAIDHAPQACAKLTAREAEVLALVVEGNTNRYIAHKLAVKEGTIKRIVSNGYRKLGIASRAELVRYVLSDQQAQLATL